MRNLAVQNFERHFVPRQNPYLLRRKNSDWVQCHDFLKEPRIKRHLKNKCLVSVFGNRVMSNRLAFDIDNHTGSYFDQLEVFKSYDSLVREFGETPLVFRSSQSGGLHLYYELGCWYEQNEIIPVIENKIKNLKNTELRLTCNRALRLPLGKDSYLLDNSNLLPVSSGKSEQLQVINFLFTNGKIEPVDLDFWLENNCTRAIRKPKDKNKSEFLLEVQKLLENGLVLPSTRNESLLNLNWYFRAVEKKTAEQAKAELIDWINENHNGMSKDFLQSPQRVYKDIENMVTKYDESKINFKPRRRTLTAGDVAYVETVTNERPYQNFLLKLIEMKRNSEKDVIPIPSRLLDIWRVDSELKKWAVTCGFLEPVGGYWSQGRTAHCRRYRINLSISNGNEVNLSKQFTIETLKGKIAAYGVRGLAAKVGVSPAYISYLQSGEKAIDSVSPILKGKILNA